MVFRPSTFGKYVLQRRIAIGGMAEVFRARAFGAEGFEKLVAIKRMLPHLSSDAQFVSMFINEAKLAASLSHKNIAQIYDFGCIDQLYFISMEYIHGKDIADIIRVLRDRGLSTPIEMVCFLFAEVLNGLDHAHRPTDAFGNPLALIHRDISPHNILVSYEGEVKIVDFGIAKAASTTIQTTGGVLKGKYSYMSPEQAHGLPLDHRTDVFSLGVCFYEMLTLQKMFKGANDLAILEKVRETDFIKPRDINPAIPEELQAQLLRALEKNPQDRWSGGAEWRDALENFMFSNGLHYSSAWLASFMREIFREEIERERAEFAEEAQVVERLRTEARRAARLEAAGQSPETQVLHLQVVGDDETTTRTDSSQAAPPPLPETVELQAPPVEAVEDLDDESDLATARVDRPSAALLRSMPSPFAEDRREIPPRRPPSPVSRPPSAAGRPPIREVGTDRDGTPLGYEVPTVEEPPRPAEKFPPAQDFEENLPTYKSDGKQSRPLLGPPAARLKPADLEDTSLPARKKRINTLQIAGLVLLALVGGGMSAYFFRSSDPGEDRLEKPVPIRPQEPLPEPDGGSLSRLRDASSRTGSSPDGGTAAADPSPLPPADAATPPPSEPPGAPDAGALETVDAGVALVAPADPGRIRRPPIRRPPVRPHRPEPAGEGRITVGISGGWAWVYVDGERIRATPVYEMALSSGRHRVELRDNDDRVIKAWDINLKPGAAIKLIHQ
ncbi:MAG: protein kinase [Myxococcales bacterium]|nr:protein kinase [Myxococcales bacterium]